MKGDLIMEQKKSQYIYVLNLISRLLKEENWRDKENEVVGRHFKYQHLV